MQINIFISYRTKDASVRNALASHLNVLIQIYKEAYAVDLQIWHDDIEITAGDDVQYVISEKLAGSQIVLCVLTPRYFESKWCLLELKAVLSESRANPKKRLVPIIYENFLRTEDWFGELKLIPANDKPPLSEWSNQDDALTLVVTEVEKNIKIFASPEALDYLKKRLNIINALMKGTPDLKGAVKTFMDMVTEYSQVNIPDALEVHITYSTFEEDEAKVKTQDLAEVRCSLMKKMWSVITVLDKKYAA
jgi:hypothetical protein